MVLASSGGGWFGVVGGIVSGLVMLCVDVVWCAKVANVDVAWGSAVAQLNMLCVVEQFLHS